MATDDKDPEPGSKLPGAGTDKPKEFIDRDDDQSPTRVDSDYEPGFPPGSSDDDEAPDPGYAAFSSDLEDPLADWPAPELDSEESPKPEDPVKEQDADSWLQRGSGTTPDGFDDPNEARAADDNSDHSSDHLHDDFREDMGSFDDVADDESGDYDPVPAPGEDDMLFSDDDEPIDVNEVDSVDRDRGEPASAAESPFPGPGAIPADVPAVSPESSYNTEFLTEDEAAPAMDVPAPPEDDYDDEFIDDFLNDLDTPEEEDSDPNDLDPFDDDEALDTESLAAAAPASAIQRAFSSDDDDDDDGDNDEEIVVRQPQGEAAASTQQDNKMSEKSLPVGMIVVVLVALALLAVGGYGVIQQRGEMQAEIRELQSRLATAPTPEEAGAERERQRQVALENESLGAELEALAAENSDLSAQLASLEEQLVERTARAEAAEEEARLAAAAAESAAQKAAAAPVASTPAASATGGPWFVNFGSYASREVADRWADKLAVESGQVMVQTATAAGKTLYRVRVVGLATQDAAERVATALEREYRLPRLWVGRS